MFGAVLRDICVTRHRSVDGGSKPATIRRVLKTFIFTAKEEDNMI